VTFCLQFSSAEQTSSLQVVMEASNDQDHADGNLACRDIDASTDAVCDASNADCLNGSRVSHGVAQAAIHSQVASQRAGLAPCP
jgi:hypothetical protein